MTLSVLTLREAVNVVMRATRSNPLVSDAELERNPTARSVVEDLEVHRKVTLLQGFFFNTEAGRVLSPSPTDKSIVLPSNVLRIGPNTKYKVLGRKLYDSIQGTYEHQGSVRLDLIIDIPWDELPFAAQNYLAWKTAYGRAAVTDLPRTHLQAVLSEYHAAEAALNNHDETHRP